MVLIPNIVDISHWDTVDSFEDAKNAGIWGIIAKSTQGVSYVDPTYQKNIANARAAGMLVGTYHFNDSSDPKAQVAWHLKHANLQPDMMTAIDFEDYVVNNKPNNMTIQGLVTWLREFERIMGFKAVIYSGNRIKDNIGLLNADDKAYVNSHRLWLAHYSETPILPSGFKSLWIHQFTGDGQGPMPHTIPGIRNPGGSGLDLDRYPGTLDELKLNWAEKPSLPQGQILVSTAKPDTPSAQSPGTPAPEKSPYTQSTGNTSPQNKANESPLESALDRVVDTFKGWFG